MPVEHSNHTHYAINSKQAGFIIKIEESRSRLGSSVYWYKI